MHRRNLLDLLREYGERHPQESATLERFVAFVGAFENCFERDCWAGHVTGSSWLVNPAQDSVLLTHHKKLGKWLQLGGHSDGDSEPLAVATREAIEESGVGVSPMDQRIFDIDIHEIPARKRDPAHYHFDVRFLLIADSDKFSVSEESLDLAWVPVAELAEVTRETSIMRMRRKWLQRVAI